MNDAITTHESIIARIHGMHFPVLVIDLDDDADEDADNDPCQGILVVADRLDYLNCCSARLVDCDGAGLEVVVDDGLLTALGLTEVWPGGER